jgi:H+/Na+-translocating ferredoxin:NAD+ oxidoreductase subunit B
VAGSLADRLDALLPQTQCARCGYPGCRPYAEALAAGAAGSDQCPPGGDATAAALAALLGQPARPVSSAFGREVPPRVAVIDEDVCIGCAKCLPACPVDAIVGAHHHLHTVIAAECSGCELCLPPCPVDCISMVEFEPALLSFTALQRRARQYRERFEAHRERAAEREAARAARLASRPAANRHT